MNSIGYRIKQARLDQGLSQVELAQAANVSQPTVANWENDSHVPRQIALDKLAGILSTSATWIRIGDIDINDAANTSAGYLTRPIQHVPISAWPTISNIKDGKLSMLPARDYIALSILADKPFALIANDPAMAAHFPVGVAIVFDATPGELASGKCYLFAVNENIILRRWRSAPDRLEALPNQSAVDAEFVETRPRPLARVVMSLRRH
ncbi:MAG: helix-turn-helix domain-containing protein [Robiginitomaculum sp.]|nr:helix-turn-helix domain-containing protein [Robiginitomaculum sp.]